MDAELDSRSFFSLSSVTRLLGEGWCFSSGSRHFSEWPLQHCLLDCFLNSCLFCLKIGKMELEKGSSASVQPAPMDEKAPSEAGFFWFQIIDGKNDLQSTDLQPRREWGGEIRQKALGNVAGAFASVHPLTAVPGGRG